MSRYFRQACNCIIHPASPFPLCRFRNLLLKMDMKKAANFLRIATSGRSVFDIKWDHLWWNIREYLIVFHSYNAGNSSSDAVIVLLLFVQPKENTTHYQWKDKYTDIDMFNAANKWNKSNNGYYQSDDCNAFIDFLIHAIELLPHFWFPTKQSFRSCYQSTTNYSANSNSACIFPEQSISELCEEIYQLLKTPPNIFVRAVQGGWNIRNYVSRETHLIS